MTLVDGEELLRIIGAGLAGEQVHLPAPDPMTAPACPACGGQMVWRTGRRGPRAGEDFLGCSGFPACRTTMAIGAEVSG